jgi:hypothetical protein
LQKLEVLFLPLLLPPIPPPLFCHENYDDGVVQTGSITFEGSNDLEIKFQGGLQFNAPEGIVFVPGFFCQLIVKYLKKLNVCPLLTFFILYLLLNIFFIFLLLFFGLYYFIYLFILFCSSCCKNMSGSYFRMGLFFDVLGSSMANL